MMRRPLTFEESVLVAAAKLLNQAVTAAWRRDETACVTLQEEAMKLLASLEAPQ